MLESAGVKYMTMLVMAYLSLVSMFPIDSVVFGTKYAANYCQVQS